MIRICGHEYFTNLSFRPFYERTLAVCVFPGGLTNELIDEFKDAEFIETLGKKKEVVATHRLVGWHSVEKVQDGSFEGIAISWYMITQTEVDALRRQLAELQNENQALREQNETLTDALLELAGIVGEEAQA